MKFLQDYKNDVLGPVQRDEAIALYGIALTLRAKWVLEFGTYFGHSTRCFLEAGANVICVDCRLTPEARALAADYPGQVTLIEADQADGAVISRIEDIIPLSEGLDVIFMDASHDLQSNIAAFVKVQYYLNKAGLVIVHDTGCWAKEHMSLNHTNFPGGKWVDDTRFAHQPDEIEFANWLRDIKGFARIDLHSLRTLRHGTSLFQQQADLPLIPLHTRDQLREASGFPPACPGKTRDEFREAKGVSKEQ